MKDDNLDRDPIVVIRLNEIKQGLFGAKKAIVSFRVRTNSGALHYFRNIEMYAGDDLEIYGPDGDVENFIL